MYALTFILIQKIIFVLYRAQLLRISSVIAVCVLLFCRFSESPEKSAEIWNAATFCVVLYATLTCIIEYYGEYCTPFQLHYTVELKLVN